jgi:hypothetical protein
MRQLVAAVFLTMLFVNMARADNNRGQYTTTLAPTCNEYLRDYATASITDTGSRLEYSTSFGNDIGWIAGYMSHVNSSIRGKSNYFNDLINEVVWIASWCRDNSSFDLDDAMRALTKIRIR